MKTIGGSTIGKIMGLSRWGGPMDAYLQLSELVEKEAGDAAYWGKEAQPAILKRYNKETGNNMAICDIEYQHPAYEFLHFTPDALRAEMSPQWPQSDLVMEMKETTIRDAWGDPGTDEVPDEVALQCQFYIMGCEAESADVAVHFLRPRHEFAIYHIPRNEEVIAAIIESARDFWMNHLLPQIPPPLDGSEATRDLLRHLYPESKGEVLPAPDDAWAWRVKLEQANRQLKEFEEQKKLAQHHLEALVGDADSLLFDDGARFDWKRQKGRTVIDWYEVSTILGAELSEIMGEEHAHPFINETIKLHTTTKPGIRVARLWPAKKEK